MKKSLFTFIVTIAPMIISAQSYIHGPMSLAGFQKNGKDASQIATQYFGELGEIDIHVAFPESFSFKPLPGNLDLTEYISDSWQVDGNGGRLMGEMPIVAAASIDDHANYFFTKIRLPYIVGGKVTVRPMKENLYIGNLIELELRNVAGDMTIDVRPQLTVIKHEDMSKYSNADTVVIYNFDFAKPVLDKYNHCVGIYLRKQCYPALLIKIALDDEGFANMDYYINALFDSLHFGDNPHPYFVECEATPWLGPARGDLNFPTEFKISEGTPYMIQ